MVEFNGCGTARCVEEFSGHSRVGAHNHGAPRRCRTPAGPEQATVHCRPHAYAHQA